MVYCKMGTSGVVLAVNGEQVAVPERVGLNTSLAEFIRNETRYKVRSSGLHTHLSVSKAQTRMTRAGLRTLYVRSHWPSVPLP